jgi:aspartyl/glutamyl-tRNA(Asn/Gln) amidotransferase C subunit
MRKIDIKRISSDIKIKLNDKEQEQVSNFISSHVKYFETFQNYNTDGLEILSSPYEKPISFKTLRKDIAGEPKAELIKSNTKHIKDNFVVFKSNDTKDVKLDLKSFNDNSIITKLDLKSSKPSSSLLKGKTIGVKDNFTIEGVRTTGSTNILNNFIPNYDSSVVYRLLDASGHITCKTNLDELAMGGTGTFSPFGTVPNPQDKNHIIGGSSSGSAYVVATGLVDISIGSDTGDSVRKPAANSGIIGFKPT